MYAFENYCTACQKSFEMRNWLHGEQVKFETRHKVRWNKWTQLPTISICKTFQIDFYMNCVATGHHIYIQIDARILHIHSTTVVVIVNIVSLFAFDWGKSRFMPLYIMDKVIWIEQKKWIKLFFCQV